MNNLELNLLALGTEGLKIDQFSTATLDPAV